MVGPSSLQSNLKPGSRDPCSPGHWNTVLLALSPKDGYKSPSLEPENSGVRGQQREQPRQMDAVINGDEES